MAIIAVILWGFSLRMDLPVLSKAKISNDDSVEMEMQTDDFRTN
jgi:hypothetical protein